MNILFLDYDGVVNTPMWSKTSTGKLTYQYGLPRDNKVNNWQACQWISEFCEKFEYRIVVTSTWRLDDNYQECLRNGGLRPDVEIIGRTPDLANSKGTRADEIEEWLLDHPEVTAFIIVDNENIGHDEDSDCGCAPLDNHFVRCSQDCGFNMKEYSSAEQTHEWLKDNRFNWWYYRNIERKL